MKSLIIYDSAFGNTKKIAEVVYSGLAGEKKLATLNETNVIDLIKFDLIIFGSPTQGGRATQAMNEFLSKIPSGSLKGVSVAAFDTRFLKEEQNFGLKVLMGIIGYASNKMIKSLTEKGGHQIGNPEGFIVESKEGPLRVGEIERAEEWGKDIQRKGVYG